MKKKKFLIGIGVVAVIIIVVIVIRNKAKGNSIQSIQASTATNNIPSAVLNEDPADWIGETLTYQGVKYKPINGVWTII